MTNGDRQPTEEIWIGGRPVDALVDTGAIISSRGNTGLMVVTADGQPMNPRGKVSLTFTNKNASMESEALVLKTFGPEFIMGKIY
ncbi:hypothetical protein OUZ56_030073 [Daphnia magna]|uniref:Retropepsins domain-containing protein n=1 Tax=Daphnia magna TaxID=35525 RepID=A0ABQ9ZQM3_9CRUS|nr:hypothetical protein OUZ56_030073 [Daphnia magna]